MRPLVRTLQATALAFLIPWTAAALDRARFTASPEPGRAEAFAVRLDGDMLMSGRLGDLARIQRLRDSLEGDFLWMRQEGLEYLFQDPDLLTGIGELWSRGDEVLRREEQELAEGRGAPLAERKRDLERRREEVRREQERVAREESRLSDEDSVLHWRELDCEMALLRVEDEDSRYRLLREIDDIQRTREEIRSRQDLFEREADEWDLRMEELDREVAGLEHEEDGIGKVRGEIDARRDELFLELDRFLLQGLERAIAQGVEPLTPR